MLRPILVFLLFMLLSIPAHLFAADSLDSLNAVVKANAQTQPGLQNYLARIETARIEEMMARLTKGIPEDVKAPLPPEINKFWQRYGKSLVYTKNTQLTPYVDKMVKQISANLAVELNEMLLPADQAERRNSLTRKASVKSSEVALAGSLIQRLEINFDPPADLNQAFYVSGMRLPQKQIKTLTFDIDTNSSTITELGIVAGNGLQLTVEVRYIEVTGGFIPERFRVTSPDGKIDDLFEVKFTEVDQFILPTSMLRVIRRPDLQENLEVFFKDYQVNQPIPEDIQARLDQQ